MAVPGSLIGAGVFVALDEGIIAIALGLILLALIWLVPKGISFGNRGAFCWLVVCTDFSAPFSAWGCSRSLLYCAQK